jgi:NitT/TauT family transport system permease protein
MRFKLILFSVIILFWHGAAQLINNQLILPGPLDVLHYTIPLIKNPGFYGDIGITLLRSLSGLIIALAAGMTAGALMGYKPLISQICKPLIVFIQSTPVISWLLIVLLWIRPESVASIITFIAAFPVIVINMETGIHATDSKYLEMARVFKVSRKSIIQHIYIPSLRHYILSSLSITGGLAVKVAVMAEVLAHPGNGLGERLFWARQNIEMPALISYTLVIVALTLIITGTVERFKGEQ